MPAVRSAPVGRIISGPTADHRVMYSSYTPENVDHTPRSRYRWWGFFFFTFFFGTSDGWACPALLAEPFVISRSVQAPHSQLLRRIKSDVTNDPSSESPPTTMKFVQGHFQFHAEFLISSRMYSGYAQDRGSSGYRRGCCEGVFLFLAASHAYVLISLIFSYYELYS